VISQISDNVRDIRSFSETKWKKNLGEGRAEPRTVHPLLYAPTTERRRAQRGTKRSGVSSKNIFRSYSSDRLPSLIINLIFFVLKNERGVRGEFHFSKHIIFSLEHSGVCSQKMILCFEWQFHAHLH
jgi:hypothetical protein